ncbi:aminoacyl tRNA synthase complex-interacting multifunctional protein 2 isoform X1 [Triplophysa rosa]|uniref:Aminoacyl tRNA synthase complex-interacting multifunctional protein 2 n=1 Tax=Triplophysa rosa TaxID=992332 RepID=A0A9W7TRE4_TRIRA|nr:aminoacyl tRNA synthase complex-interacting multifunctional protein 2 isoform X1 [Triplophysa rosa]KAI7803923.1 aminoacyl tRNA synthase complex-interacting multifunctional protein 2 [Triplophysa rosa]
MPMYQVKPVSPGEIKIDLPTCMYKLPNIHAQGTSRGEHAFQNGEVDPAVKVLEAQQDDILKKLYELKATVDGLTKTVTTPDADLDATTLSQGVSATVSKGTADLDSLLGKDLGALRDIVINANPSNPPLSLLVLHSLLCQRYRVLSTVHVHSSVTSVPPTLLSCLGPRHADSYTRHRFELGFTLIWKDVSKLQMKFNTQNMCPIEGEANVARFLYRLLGAEPQDPVLATQMDSWIDTAVFQLAEGSSKEQAAVLRSLNGALGRSPWLLGQEFSLADIVSACCVLQASDSTLAPANVQRWLKSCQNLGHFNCAYELLH